MGVLVLRVSESSPKAGVIVSRKLAGKAVARNQLKRRLRIALQHLLTQFPTPIHLVILPNRRALGAKVEELEAELKALLTIEL